MDIYEAIYTRRTVRTFKEIVIKDEIIKKIVNAGLHAPTNDHMRNWNFIIITDMAKKLQVLTPINKDRTEKDAEKVIDTWGLKDTDQRAMYLDAIPRQYHMLLQSGCLIIPCFGQKDPLLVPKTLSSLNGFASIWCCIENILLAATAEGIFGVMRIPSGEEIDHIKHVLNIPEGHEVPCYVSLGYPEENSKQMKQHNVDVEERIHNNKW